MMARIFLMTNTISRIPTDVNDTKPPGATLRKQEPKSPMIMASKLNPMEQSSVVLNPFSNCNADATGSAIMALNTRTPTILIEIDTAAAIKIAKI